MSTPVLFWGITMKNGEFSQWYQRPMTIDGTVYNCCEQYMMYKKAELFNDNVAAEKVMSAMHPAEHRKIGRTVRNFDQAVWDARKYDIVLEANRAKFSQHPDLKKMLLDTGTRLIAEASPYDRIWGIGRHPNTSEAKIPSMWRGENLLGKALMEVRSELIPICRGTGGDPLPEADFVNSGPVF